MNEQCTKIRYAYSVIDVARVLHETAIGSADLGHSKEELGKMADWLQWRISNAEWHGPISTYDDAVRTLAKLAIARYDQTQQYQKFSLSGPSR